VTYRYLVRNGIHGTGTPKHYDWLKNVLLYRYFYFKEGSSKFHGRRAKERRDRTAADGQAVWAVVSKCRGAGIPLMTNGKWQAVDECNQENIMLTDVTSDRMVAYSLFHAERFATFSETSYR
jgi:hypothetical protein